MRNFRGGTGATWRASAERVRPRQPPRTSLVVAIRLMALGALVSCGGGADLDARREDGDPEGAGTAAPSAAVPMASDTGDPGAVTVPPEADVSAISPEWCRNLPRPIYATLARRAVDDGWYEVYEVGDGVLAIYEPRQWQEVISYLIVGGERALLFDTGMGIAPIRDIVARLTPLPVTVLNSHTHFDHTGGNADFERVLAMDTDYTRAATGGDSSAVVRDEVRPHALCGPLPAGFDPATYRSRPFTVSEFVRDGHQIALGGRLIEVLHIPGHTPDAIALLDRAAGHLWTGDTFYEGPIWLFWDGTDVAAYGRSVDRLAALVPSLTRVFPGHNTAVAAPSRILELRDAFREVMAGTREPTIRDDGLREYDFGAFSFLMQPSDPD